MTWFYREHTADIAVVARSRSLSTLLGEMVQALGNIQADLSSHHSRNKSYTVNVKGKIEYINSHDLVWELCDLLNTWLSCASLRSALLFELCTLQLLEGRNLIKYEGIVKMIPWEEISEKKTEIKAVTYSGAYFIKKGFYWEWQICIDV